MKPHALALFGIAAALAVPAQAALIVTYAENPGAQNSSLSGTSVFDFNSLPLGKDVNVAWKGVGTFDQLYIMKPDQYGGAVDATHPNGTQYSVQGVGTSVKTTDLKLNAPSSYFGFWWSAGDASNVLDFYKGNTLVGEFTTASLLGNLSRDYYGNPRNTSLDAGEPFAFINFFGDTGTSWDNIVLHNSTNSGFESDNYTNRFTAWDPAKDGGLPGVPVVLVDGKTTTKVTKDKLAGTRWAQNAMTAPGAPAPPLPLLGAFGLLAALRGRKNKKA